MSRSRCLLVWLACLSVCVSSRADSDIVESSVAAKPAPRGLISRAKEELASYACQIYEQALLSLALPACQCYHVLTTPTGPERSIVIHVVDADDKPVVAAIAIVIEGKRNKAGFAAESASEEKYRLTLTWLDGTVRVRRPATLDAAIHVAVICKGFAPASVEWNWQEDPDETIPHEYTLRLEKGLTIGGVVQDTAGNPIAGACLRPWFDTKKDSRDLVFPYQAITDSQGRWRCGQIPAQFENLRINVSHTEHADLRIDSRRLSSQLASLQDCTGVFVMQPGLPVQGRVIDAEGRPIFGAHVGLGFLDPTDVSTSGNVTLLPPTSQTRTDDDGRYRFAPCSPGKIRLLVAASGCVSQRREIDLQPGTADADFLLSPGSPVKIHVVDPGGTPLAGAFVRGDNDGCSRYEPIVTETKETDGDGRWSSGNSPEAEMPLEIGLSGYMTVHQRFAAREEEYVVVLPHSIRISGRALDGVSNEPIQKVFVSLKRIRSEKEPRSMGVPSLNVNEKGEYELTFDNLLGVDQVSWQLCVQAPGYEAQFSRPFETKEGSQMFDFALAKGKALSGVVKRPDGSPVAGAKVAVSTVSEANEDDRCETNAPSSPEQTVTTGDGRFELPMPSKPFTLHVEHDLGVAAIAAKDFETRGEIVLRPWARVEGIIRGSVVEPGRERETISLHREKPKETDTHPQETDLFTERHFSADPDSAGSFVFKEIPPGRYEISPSVHEFPVVDGQWFLEWRQQYIDAVEGQTTHVEFIRKGRSVTGTAVMPPAGSREISVAGGCGCLLFQRPYIPTPKEIAEASAAAREALEKEWLASEAGKAADRAAHNYCVRVEANGSLTTKDVAPGVYKLMLELRSKRKSPDDWGEQVAWFAQEVTIPEADAASDIPFDLGKLTLNLAKIFRGDLAPDFSFTTEDGQTHRLSEYRGKRVSLYFSKTWIPWKLFPTDGQGKVVWYPGNPDRGDGEVWINLTSDPRPRPTMAPSSPGDPPNIHGFVQPDERVMERYDVRRPDEWSPRTIVVAEDGTIVRR